MSVRAKFDAAVVSEWTRRRQEFRHRMRWMWWLFWLLVLTAPFPFFLHMIEIAPAAYGIAFLLIFIGVHLRFRYAHIIPCPHCGKPPAPRFQRLVTYDLDCCAHCRYWLLNPGGVAKNV
jgi:hypothetical protein